MQVKVDGNDYACISELLLLHDFQHSCHQLMRQVEITHNKTNDSEFLL